MSGSVQFQQLVSAGNQIGEVIGVDRFLIRVRGLQPINVHAVVMFEDGSKGYVHHVYEDFVMVLHLGKDPITIGMIAVVQNSKLVTRVGEKYLGRVISVLGEPLDGKGPIEPDGTWPIFHTAPSLYERELLDTPFETGIITIDVLYSLVRGQRMALLGDGKTGKSSLATQIAINQRDTDIVTIYVMIGKRRADLIELVDRLEQNNAMEKTIIVVSTMFESLIMNYLAPYVGAALGEYLWQHQNMDTFVVYDDLTSHAMTYREISLIAGVSPGRDSYPGDMFYTHSSLIERAGKLSRNHKSQTILPLVYAPSGDITAYLPTNVMSMTDGQWILDMEVFREVMRPAVSTGLSVTRVGGVGQNKRQKALGVQTNKAIAAFKQAEEYAHFGSELSKEAEADLIKGKNIFRLFNQIVGETYNFMSQQLLLDIVLNLESGESVDMDKLKHMVADFAARVENDDSEQSNYEALRDELKAACLVQKVEKNGKKESDETDAESEQHKDKKDKKPKHAKESAETKEDKEDKVDKPDAKEDTDTEQAEPEMPDDGVKKAPDESDEDESEATSKEQEEEKSDDDFVENPEHPGRLYRPDGTIDEEAEAARLKHRKHGR